MFCPTPFSRLHIYTNGEASLCYGFTWNTLPVGNILTDDVSAIWTGPLAAEKRQSILDQSFRYCADCRCPELIERRPPPASIDLSTIDCLALAYDYTCNISCPSCRRDLVKHSPRSREVHEATIKSGIYKIARSVSISGSGEPLASKLFWDLMRRWKDIDCHPQLGIILCSNGLWLSPQVVDKIRGYGKPIYGAEISVDAATAETYAKNRRGGDFERLCANLSRIVDCGVPLRVNFVVQANNFREMPAFVELALSWKASCVRFDAVNQWGAWSDAEYRQRAVQFPSHPLHTELVRVLRDPSLRDERVRTAQLSDSFFAHDCRPHTTILALAREEIP
ncbi:MAG TPA: radical SAM protein [Conexivisphaerales archaeon]|nr:radical SAM protein [Conexivisphaerales archaeon]